MQPTLLFSNYKSVLDLVPEAVDSVLRVVELDRRAQPQIQGPDGLLTLQQGHTTTDDM